MSQKQMNERIRNKTLPLYGKVAEKDALIRKGHVDNYFPENASTHCLVGVE